jgi:hypothetical protein
MLKKLIEKLKSMTTGGVSFDPSTLGDPVAMRTEWNPAKGGGASFCTHKLVTVNSNRMEFRASIGAKLFYLVFLIAGLGVMFAFSGAKLSSGGFAFDMETIMPLSIGLIFSCVGGCLLYFGTAPIVFDKRRGYFWKGRKSPAEVSDKRSLKHFAQLDEIHALQLISEYCSGDKSSYYSYEMNIVLKDGQRINVVDHGKQSKLKDDAGVIAGFLGVPVWDAV